MQKVKLNIVPKGVKKTTYLSQNDNGRVVRYELFNELIPYILDGSETITLKVVRPDGEEILANIENTFEGEAYIDVSFNDDMSAITGVGAGEIKITDGETELGSHNFDINVEIDAYNGKDVVIKTETGTLLSFNTEVEDNALEYESEIPYNAEGYTGLRVINSRTAPVYNKTPYLFRKTPDGSGNSCIEKLTGLTVAFNQIVKTYRINASYAGITLTNNTDYVHLQGLTTAEDNMTVASIGSGTIPQGHRFLAWLHGVTSSDFKIVIGSPSISSSYGSFAVIGQSTGLTMSLALGFKSGVSIDNDVRVNCVDLTVMFGSTIADYIYNLEQATVGAGVSFFKSLGFNKPYYEYNAGSLLSSKPVSKKVVGFNQFDKTKITVNTWFSDVDGSTATQVNYSLSDYIRVLPNTTYYKAENGSGRNLYFDANKNCLPSQNWNTIPSDPRTFTTPDNAYYVRFTITTASVNSFCVNFSDPEKNGTYEPYSEETYNLGGDELRGLLKLDANNNIYADGDIKTSDGNIKRRYGIVDLGSLAWNYSGDVDRFISEAIPVKPSVNDNTAPNILCVPYITVDFNNFVHNTPNKTITSPIANGKINIRDTSYGTDSAAFKTAMNGIYLIYEKETLESESADPYTDPQEVKVTEEFIDGRAVEIPVGHDTIYGTDIEYQDIDFDTTIFGGEIDAVNGVLSSEYNSDGSVKPTPEIIDITPTPIPVKAGDNKIFNTANGNQTIRYYNQVEE